MGDWIDAGANEIWLIAKVMRWFEGVPNDSLW